MPVTRITTYLADSFQGIGDRVLETKKVALLKNNDRAIVCQAGMYYYFLFDEDATNATDLTNHPYKLRPADYVDKGVWFEQYGVPFDALGKIFSKAGIQIDPAQQPFYIPEYSKIEYDYDTNDNMITKTYKMGATTVAVLTMTYNAKKLLTSTERTNLSRSFPFLPPASASGLFPIRATSG